MPFTDAHFLMALVGAERDNEADAYRRSIGEFASSDDSDAAKVTQEIGVPLAEALCAYGANDYAAAAGKLYQIRHDLAPLGGSHAQQDVFHQILIDAATKAGKTDMARSLLRERCFVRSGSSWAPQRLASLQ